jgi:hypothetical protein
MNCAECGAALAPGARFCSNCGAQVEQPAEAQVAVPITIAEKAKGFTGRVWALDQVAEWLDGGAERFLLLTGEPGSGKSALAAWLAGTGDPPENVAAKSRLQQVRASWHAAHFCVADQQRGSVNPIRFAQSLASQLADRHEEYARAALERIAPEIRIEQQAREVWGTVIGAQIGKLIVTSNPEDVYNRAVREPLEELASKRPDLRVNILVDALDEAMTVAPPNIVTLLAGSGDFPAGARFLLTSRNDPKVTEQFKDVRRLNLTSDRWAQESNRDIAVYVKGRLREPKLWQRLGGEDSAALAAQLVEQAAGNFLYVRFLLDDVAEGHRTLADMASLPPGLYGLYRTYLDRLFPGMLATGGDQRWLQFQALLGCMGVAVPAAPRRALPGWLAQQDGEVAARLAEVTQVSERIRLPDAGAGQPGDGYRLYHQSFAEFLISETYRDDGEVTDNRYYTPPRDQHRRIARYYLDGFRGHWEQCDRYGLRQLVGHLAAWLALEVTPAARQAVAELLYGVVLDDSFRAAQMAKLGDVSATLADLRTAIDVALARDDLVEALACIGAYRRMARAGSTPEAVLESILAGMAGRPPRTGTLAQAIFAAVDAGDIGAAHLQAKFYSAAPDWGRAVHLYLAWEAAERGDPATAGAAVAAARSMPVAQAQPICDALLVRTARALAATGAEGRDVRGWLTELGWGERAEDMLASFRPAVSPGPTAKQQALTQLDDRLSYLEHAYAFGDDPEAAIEGIDEERAGLLVQNLLEAMLVVAADPLGQAAIDRALNIVLPNPYPPYRDSALVAVGVACLAVHDPEWVRRRLRRILGTVLESEGIAFTFDLPAILQGEAERRGLPVPQALAEYVARGLATEDIWGTAVRAHSARAAALLRQDRTGEAFDAVQHAASRRTGFVGYATVTLLALVNRCLELGEGERAAQPIWLVPLVVNFPAVRDALPPAQRATLDELVTQLQQVRADSRFGLGQPLVTPIDWPASKSLLEAAAAAAANVRDPRFRQQRMSLVLASIGWWRGPAPDPTQGRTSLAAIGDRDTRLAYVDHVSARWSRQPDSVTWEGLKSLVPIALEDGTTLDSVLGRLLGQRLTQLTGQQLGEAIRICTTDLTTGRPWELWPPPLE